MPTMVSLVASPSIMRNKVWYVIRMESPKPSETELRQMSAIMPPPTCTISFSLALLTANAFWPSAAPEVS